MQLNHGRGQTSVMHLVDECCYTEVVEPAPLKAPEPGMSVEELEVIEAHVAKKLLEQNGWAILAELHRNCLTQLGLTKFFVLPVIATMDEIKVRLGDHADEFETAFDQLREDIEAASASVLELASMHTTRTETPVAEELTEIEALADLYNTMLNQLDTVIGQKMLSQLAVLQEYGISADNLTNVYNTIVAPQQ